MDANPKMPPIDDLKFLARWYKKKKIKNPKVIKNTKYDKYNARFKYLVCVE